MEVKRFVGRSWEEALEKTKRKFGSDAVILYTSSPEPNFFQKIFGNQKYIVVAARDMNIVTDTSRPDPAGHPDNGIKDVLQDKYASSDSTSRIADMLEDVATKEDYNSSTDSILPPDQENGTSGDAPPPSGSNGNGMPSELDASSPGLDKIESMLDDLTKFIKHNEVSDTGEELFSTYQKMLENNISKVIAVNIIERIQETLEPEELQNQQTIERAIRNSLKQMIQTAEPINPDLDSCNSVAVVGPTGVGKTTTIAKLAGNFVLQKDCSVGLVTIDTYRLGAATQLQKVASLLEVPCRSAKNPEDFRETMNEMDQFDLVLIDTLGTSQNDQEKIDHLNEFFEASTPDQVHLVLSASSNDDVMEDSIQAFSPLDIDRIIFSKIDEASRRGLILNILNKIDAGISYITTGQEIPKDIRVARDEELADLILGEEHHA